MCLDLLNGIEIPTQMNLVYQPGVCTYIRRSQFSFGYIVFSDRSNRTTTRLLRCKSDQFQSQSQIEENDDDDDPLSVCLSVCLALQCLQWMGKRLGPVLQLLALFLFRSAKRTLANQGNEKRTKYQSQIKIPNSCNKLDVLLTKKNWIHFICFFF